jgi:hypothetical protein
MVGAYGDFDPDRQVWRSSVIVLLEPPAHFTRLDAHNGIVSCRVIRVAMEDLGPDGTFFQEFMMSLKTVMDDIGEKFFSPRGAAKRRTLEYFSQFT